MNTRRTFGCLGLLAAMALALLPFHSVRAQTVDELTKRGSINIGVLVDGFPFGGLDEHQQLVGYDIDVANLLAKYLGVKANLVQLTSPNKIPFLTSGKADIVVATVGITPERARTVWFSIPYSAVDNVVYAPKDKNIKSAEDLKGLRVGLPRGTVQDVILTKQLGDSVKIMRFEDDPSVFQAMLTGQVDAIAENAVTGDAFFAKNPTPAANEQKFIVLRAPNGIIVRADQINLHQWINTFIYYIKNNGELNAIHEKWFHKPLPQLPVF